MGQNILESEREKKEKEARTFFSSRSINFWSLLIWVIHWLSSSNKPWGENHEDNVLNRGNVWAFQNFSLTWKEAHSVTD